MKITFREIFGIIIVVQSFLIYIPYIYQTIKGKLRPQPITWVIACLSGGSIGLILMFNHAGPGAWGYLFTAFFTLILSVVAFSTYYKSTKISRSDIVFLGLAILSLALWLLSRDLAVISVILLSISSIFGAVPTLTKVWKSPRSESLYVWAMFLSQAVFGIIATVNLDFVNTFRRAVMIAINFATISTMIYRRRRVKPDAASIHPK